MEVKLNINTKEHYGRQIFITNVILSQKSNFTLDTVFCECEKRGANIQKASILLCLDTLKERGEIIRYKDHYELYKGLFNNNKNTKKDNEQEAER